MLTEGERIDHRPGQSLTSSRRARVVIVGEHDGLESPAVAIERARRGRRVLNEEAHDASEGSRRDLALGARGSRGDPVRPIGVSLPFKVFSYPKGLSERPTLERLARRPRRESSARRKRRGERFALEAGGMWSPSARASQ